MIANVQNVGNVDSKRLVNGVTKVGASAMRIRTDIKWVLQSQKFTKTWAREKHPNWEGIRIVRRILDANKDANTAVLIKTLKASYQEIALKDGRLGVLLNRVLTTDEDELFLLNGLLEKIKEGSAEGILDFLMQEYRGKGGNEPLPQRLARFKDAGLAKSISEILKNARTLEYTAQRKLKSLQYFMSELRSLGNESNSLDNYIRTARDLIKYLKETYPEDELIKKIEDSNVIKQLMNYYLEIQKLEEYLGLIKRGLKEGSWDEFLKVFYPKLDEEIKVIRDKFGDLQTATVMKKAKDDQAHYGQQPLAWQRLIEWSLARKKSEEHIRALIGVCYKTISTLVNEEVNRVNEVVHHQLNVQLMKVEGRIKARINEFKDIKANVKSILRDRETGLGVFYLRASKLYKKWINAIADYYLENLGLFGQLTALSVEDEARVMQTIARREAPALDYLREVGRRIPVMTRRIEGNRTDAQSYNLLLKAIQFTYYLNALERAEGPYAQRGRHKVGQINDMIPRSIDVINKMNNMIMGVVWYLLITGFTERGRGRILQTKINEPAIIDQIGVIEQYISRGMFDIIARHAREGVYGTNDRKIERPVSNDFSLN